MESDIATIAKYTNSETEILLCEHSKKSTFGKKKMNSVERIDDFSGASKIDSTYSHVYQTSQGQ